MKSRSHPKFVMHAGDKKVSRAQKSGGGGIENTEHILLSWSVIHRIATAHLQEFRYFDVHFSDRENTGNLQENITNTNLYREFILNTRESLKF